MIALFLALLAPAGAADVCRGFDIVEGDPSRGPAVVISDGVNTLSRIDDAPVLRVPFYEIGSVTHTVPAGTEIDWMLADGSLVTLVTRDAAVPSAVTYGSDGGVVGVQTRWQLAFVLDDDVLHAMARSPLERLRYTLVSTPVDRALKRRRTVGWQRLAACYANLRAR